jgi:hypothetical protein
MSKSQAVSKPYVVTAHGKSLVVYDVITKPVVSKSQKALQEGFAMIPLTWAARVAKAVSDPSYLVLAVLTYLLWKTQKPVVILSNECLRPFGINRYAKYRALARLEKAGVIHVEHQPRRAPVVTLLMRP